ncbi:hypothetical protein ONE63_000027 [Megalurothrips usitatus]|uniref:Uncharacterized protein n=1 Tax=Megalurothrips usitatus TaxID=439358 RepID=A0AAV7Y123_9NEOP|nr:hypothetical protein ONE63_000027 [Megalurothrips usitatus]
MKKFVLILGIVFVAVALAQAGKPKNKQKGGSSDTKPTGENNPTPPGRSTSPAGRFRSISPGGSVTSGIRDQHGQQATGTVHAGGGFSKGTLHKPLYGGRSDSPPRHIKSQPSSPETSPRRAGPSGRH